MYDHDCFNRYIEENGLTPTVKQNIPPEEDTPKGKPCHDCGTPEQPILADDDTADFPVTQHYGTEGYIPKPLQITQVSQVDDTLKITFKSLFSNTRHNYLVIVVNEQDFHTPALFFGGYHLRKCETREVWLTPHENGRSVILERPTCRAGYTRLL